MENIGAASVAVLFRLRGESQKEFPAPDFHPFGLDVSAFGDARFGQRFQVGDGPNFRAGLYDAAFEIVDCHVGFSRRTVVVSARSLHEIHAAVVYLVSLPCDGGRRDAESRERLQPREIADTHLGRDVFSERIALRFAAVGEGLQRDGLFGKGFRFAERIDHPAVTARSVDTGVEDGQLVVRRVDGGIHVEAAGFDEIIFVGVPRVMGRAGVIADARDDLFVPVVAVVHPIGVIAYPDETLVARLFDGHVRGVAVETEGHVLRSLSVGHTARNQNFVSIGHLRVENFAAGVDVEALHDRIGRQLDEPAENDSIAQRRIDPRRVRGADRDADRASGVAGGRFGRYGRRTDVAARDDAPCIDRNRLRRRSGSRS